VRPAIILRSNSSCAAARVTRDVGVRYLTVYDLAQAGYQEWYVPVFGLLFLLLAGVLLRYRGLFPATGPTSFRRVFPWAGLGLAVLWTAAYFAATFARYRSLRDALVSGEAQVVEGPVTDFVPMPYEGHSLEHFTVNGHHFAYSDFMETPGFHSTSSHGGPIRAGLRVRIASLNGVILRVEIAR
jgi:hypothetical protein